jgi:hypothetical protein
MRNKKKKRNTKRRSHLFVKNREDFSAGNIFHIFEKNSNSRENNTSVNVSETRGDSFTNAFGFSGVSGTVISQSIKNGNLSPSLF